jgi:hypothetical protein
MTDAERAALLAEHREALASGNSARIDAIETRMARNGGASSPASAPTGADLDPEGIKRVQETIAAGKVAEQIKKAKATVGSARAAEIKALAAGLRPIISSLEKRVRDLEGRQSSDTMRFRGTWAASRTFGRGDTVVHQGVLWFCCCWHTTTTRPGSGDDWVLLTKHADPRDRDRDKKRSEGD